MSPDAQPARALADLADGTILAVVEIAVPPERVFHALIDPHEVTAWWGSPDSYQVTEWAMDVRPGGAWRSRGVGADGSAFSVEGEVLEVDPPRRLAHTWRPDWDPGPATTVRYQLDPVPGGTRVTVRHHGFAGRAESCGSHAAGWERVLGWLRGRLLPAPAPAATFLIQLLPPRPGFMADMSAEELGVMQRHAVYWRELCQKGVALAFGPVADPRGGWGVGIVRVADEAAVRTIEAGDPAITSGRGFRYQILPMPTVVTAA